MPDLRNRHPLHVFGLTVQYDFLSPGGLECKSNIVMVMLGNILIGGDDVHIHVENTVFQCLQVGDTGFFHYFFHRHFSHLRVAVAVAARLEPAVEFAVVH